MIVFENLSFNPKKDLLGGGGMCHIPPPTKLVVLSKLLHLILLMNIGSRFLPFSSKKKSSQRISKISFTVLLNRYYGELFKRI